MRNNRLLKTLAVIFAFAMFAAACGDDDDATPAAATTTAAAVTTTAAAADTAAPAGEAFRVALFSPGTADDLSWSHAWNDGAELAAAANPLIEITHVELLNEPDAYVQQGSAFAEEGFDFLLFAHGAMVDPAIEVATNFPDTQVCLAPHHASADMLAATPDNLCWIDIDQHNANFLTGVIAALVTKTGKIGSINGFEFPALTRQPEGFHLGARCVNPDIGFSQEYVNTWTDTAVAKAATQALIAGGADVISSSTDSAVLGIIDAAQEADSQVWVVPAYYDSVTLGPDVVLTSAVHGLAEAATMMIERAVAGEIGPASFHSFDATNNPGIVAASLYDNADELDAASRAIFDDIDARVRSGAIAIPDETEGAVTIGAVGSAADVDVESIGCTPGTAGDPYRVALFSPGTADDLSWSHAWNDGAELAAAANPLIEITHVELLNEPDAYVQQGSAFAEEGFDFLLFAHGAMVDPAIEVATNFPDTQVCLAPHHASADMLAATPDNLCWIDIDQHNANFLTGVIAALVTKTGKIGSINGFEFPALTRQPEGFHLGARCVNPDIGFSQEYVNTWTDTAVAKAATQALIAGGADVISSSTDSAVLGIIDAAQEADSQVWVVPAYYDSVTLGPDVVLTSAVHGLAEAATMMIERAVAGEIGPASFHSFDATNNPGIVAASLYDNADELDAASRAIFDDIDARVRSGAIAIPDETEGAVTIGAVGSAADVDVESIGCTPAS